MKRRDFLADHIMQKGFIEDVMKSIAWTGLCGASFAIVISSIRNAHYFQGCAALMVFVSLTTLSIVYVAMHVVLPLDKAMYPDDPYWGEKAQNLTGLSRLIETVKIYVARKGFFYLSLSLSYFFYASAVSTYIAAQIK